MGDRTIILIGGAPSVGKSTLAQALSRRLNFPWISTDQIRGIMRSVTDRHAHPTLFNPDGYSQERLLAERSAEEIAELEFAQGEAVWTGIRSFIENDYTWSDGFVIEGVSVLPSLVARDFRNNPFVRAAFLVDESRDRMRAVGSSRGISFGEGCAALKEKDLAWAWIFNLRIGAEAARYGYPVVDIRKSEHDLEAALGALKLA